MKIYSSRKNSSDNKVLDLAKRMVAVEKQLEPEQEYLRGYPNPKEIASEIQEDIDLGKPFEKSFAYYVKEYIDDMKVLYEECDLPDDPSHPDWKYHWKYLHKYEKLYQELLALMGYNK